MLNKLVLNNFPSGTEVSMLDEGSFVMSTCQRTLVLSYGKNPNLCIQGKSEQLTGKAAYHYLLEIICGLKSKLLGENEIVGQFKTSYHNYISQKNKSTELLRIIEKLFKDAKEIRTDYLLGLCQKTYSSIARKHIVSVNKADHVLILGSGQLAEDLINQFKKKVTVFISARNTQRVQELAQTHNIEIIDWNNKELIKKFPFIANSIGFEGTLFDEDFFSSWNELHDTKLFVDLGSPSAIQTSLNFKEGVMRLEDVFQEGAVHESHKKNQVAQAKLAMAEIVKKREEIFSKDIKAQSLFKQTKGQTYVTQNV